MTLNETYQKVMKQLDVEVSTPANGSQNGNLLQEEPQPSREGSSC